MGDLVYLTKMDKDKFQIVEDKTLIEKEETYYWLAKPAIERFMALEILRQRFYNYECTANGFQRIYSIAQQV